MASFPASLASNHLETVTEAGAITPTHGGMVQGHEFDLPISQKNPDNTTQAAQAPATINEKERLSALPQNGAQTSTTQPVPRRSTSANKQRPLSMPPQPSTTAGDRQRAEDSRSGHRDGASGNRSRGSHRILGDYTLSKTLGAGSMGKVKLAHHNITGEKVCLALRRRCL
jgi:serine/threonine protein kinase KIN1/2